MWGNSPSDPFLNKYPGLSRELHILADYLFFFSLLTQQCENWSSVTLNSKVTSESDTSCFCIRCKLCWFQTLCFFFFFFTFLEIHFFWRQLLPPGQVRLAKTRLSAPSPEGQRRAMWGWVLTVGNEFCHPCWTVRPEAAFIMGRSERWHPRHPHWWMQTYYWLQAELYGPVWVSPSLRDCALLFQIRRRGRRLQADGFALHKCASVRERNRANNPIFET